MAAGNDIIVVWWSGLKRNAIVTSDALHEGNLLEWKIKFYIRTSNILKKKIF